MYIFILALLLPLNLLFHELGHIVFYLFHGIDICAFVFFKNVFVRIGNKWKRICVDNNEKSYIIPNMYSEYKIEKYERVIAGSILAGPIVTIFLLGVFSALFIIMYYNNEINTWSKVLLLLNVSVNLSILHGCIKENEGCIGDVVAYLKIKKNERFLAPYIMDYVVLNGGTNIDIVHILKCDFDKLDRKEKIDWAYDVVTLFLLGSINEVSREVAEFVYDYYVCNDYDVTVRERFRQYIVLTSMETCEEWQMSSICKSETIFEKIAEFHGINQKIIERIGGEKWTKY